VKGEGSQKSSMLFKWPRALYLARDGVFIAHTPKTSCWEDSAHLAVRPQCNSRSDCQRGNGYFQIKFSTVGVGGGLTGPSGGQTAIYIGAGGLTGHPWRSDCPGIGAGGLIDPWWWPGHQGLFRPPKIYFFGQRFSKVFNRFKFRDHSEIFTDKGEERWCSLIILDNILIRIMNLSKWQL
jgi:hypothetical protein